MNKYVIRNSSAKEMTVEFEKSFEEMIKEVIDTGTLFIPYYQSGKKAKCYMGIDFLRSSTVVPYSASTLKIS
jgi:hypothetical protein